MNGRGQLQEAFKKSMDGRTGLSLRGIISSRFAFGHRRYPGLKNQRNPKASLPPLVPRRDKGGRGPVQPTPMAGSRADKILLYPRKDLRLNWQQATGRTT